MQQAARWLQPQLGVCLGAFSYPLPLTLETACRTLQAKKVMRREQDSGFSIPPTPLCTDKYIFSAIWKLIQRCWIHLILQMNSVTSQFLKKPSFKADSKISLIKTLPATSTFCLVLYLSDQARANHRHDIPCQIRWR